MPPVPQASSYLCEFSLRSYSNLLELLFEPVYFRLHFLDAYAFRCYVYKTAFITAISLHIYAHAGCGYIAFP